MRKTIVAWILALAAALLAAPSADAASAAFSDVDDPDTAYAAAVLQGFGIVSGYEDGSFRPAQALTRAEFCKLAVMTLGRGADAASCETQTLFTDVRSGNWAAGYINLCCAEGLVSGYGNGCFGPGDGVTYAQAATILLRMLGYGAEQVGQSWLGDYVRFAARLGLDEGLALEADTPLTRGTAAQLLYRLLKLETGAGQTFWASRADVSQTQTLEGAVLVSVSENEAVYRGEGGEAAAALAYRLSEAIVGEAGTLIRDASGQVLGFLPEEGAWRDVTVAWVDGDSLITSEGLEYTLDGGVKLLGTKSAYSYAAMYAELLPGTAARLYFDESGAVSRVYAAVFSEPRIVRQLTGAVVLSVAGDKLIYLSASGGADSVELTLAEGAEAGLAGETGTLLLDDRGAVLGLLRDRGRHTDLTLGTVKAGGVTGQDGLFRALDAEVKLCVNGKLYSYNEFWYLAPVGGAARLYTGADGAPWLLYISGGGASGWTVLESTTPIAEAEAAFSLPAGYRVTKNGVAAPASAVAAGDLARYDSAANTLAVTDWRVSGAVQGFTYADGRVASVTVLGCDFPVTAAAAEAAAAFSVGSRVTLLLTDSREAAFVTAEKSAAAAMFGLLTLDGKGGASVLLDMGVTLSGKAASAQDAALDGSLVQVSEAQSGTLLGTLPEAVTRGVLDLAAGTLGKAALAADCAVYDWAGKGRAVAVELDDITWTETLPASAVSWSHLNGAGQVDILLLNNVTGDALYYGLAAVSSRTETVSGGSWVHENVTQYLAVEYAGQQSAQGAGYRAAYLRNGDKVGAVILGDGTLGVCETLLSARVGRDAFSGGSAARVGAYLLPVAAAAQAYDEDGGVWMTVAEALGRYETVTVYYDRAPEEGGKIRLVTTG